MQGVLAALKGVQQRKRKEEIEGWTEEFQQQLQALQEGEQNYYLLLLAEVYAINLRDIAKAQECLRKVQQKSQLVVFEHRLRLCYFNFLEGDYEQAINDISLMRVSIDNSTHSRRIATAFFSRVMPKQDEDDDLVQDQEERNGYEVSYIRALRQEKTGKTDSAKRILVEIFNKYGKQLPSIKYEAAKHLLLLSQSGKSKINNDKTYKAIVAEYEDSIPNKDYYLKKVQFLQIVLDILDENIDEEPINYEVIKQFILETLDKNMGKVKDKATKDKLKDLQTSILKEPYLNLDFCYNFLGEKNYQQMLKYYQQQKPKPSKPKQSTLKPPKKAQLQTQINKLKITHSEQQNTDMDPEFRGSIMTKVNMNSGGYQNRYFYFHDDFKKSKKLFFCSKEGKQSSDDEFCNNFVILDRLKGFKKLVLGKRSKALNRQECADFNEDHCFTLKIEGEEVYERNFYVQSEEDLKNWKALFHSMAQENINNDHDKIKKTLLF